MPSQRDILNKISTVKKTRQITRAMNMVAAAKLRGIEDKTHRFQLYANKYSEVLANMSSNITQIVHPLLIQSEKVNKVGLFLFTADRGLCGSFNMNLINTSLRFTKERQAIGQQIEYFLVGRKARDFYRRRGVNVDNALISVMNIIDFDLAVQIASMGINAFLADNVQEVYMIYSHFRSMAAQVPIVIKLLPISLELLYNTNKPDTEKVTLEYLVEPSAEQVLIDLFPRFVNVIVYNALLNTATSEQAARMAAMDNASKNCKELINALTLAYNKARQASITAELMDIVGGAEALKG